MTYFNFNFGLCRLKIELRNNLIYVLDYFIRKHGITILEKLHLLLAFRNQLFSFISKSLSYLFLIISPYDLTTSYSHSPVSRIMVDGFTAERTFRRYITA